MLTNIPWKDSLIRYLIKHQAQYQPTSHITKSFSKRNYRLQKRWKCYAQGFFLQPLLSAKSLIDVVCLKNPLSHSKSNKIPLKWLLHLQYKRTNTGTCNSSSIGSDTFVPGLNFLLSFHLVVDTFQLLLKLLWTYLAKI